MPKPQIIYQDNEPAFVVIPYKDYMTHRPDEELSDEQLFHRARTEDDGSRIPHDVVTRLIGGENPLKVYREWRDLNQDQLADSIGVSKGYVSQVERGVKNLSRKAQARAAEALRADYDDLEPDPVL